MSKKIIEEAKSFYEKWWIQYVMDNIWMTPKNTSNKNLSKENIIINNVQLKENGLEESSEIIEIKEKVVKIEEKKFVELINDIEVKIDDNKWFVSVNIDDVISEDKINTKQEIDGELLKDIKISIEHEQEEEVKIEIGDIFTKNTKLLRLLSNWYIIEHESWDYLEIDWKYIAYLWYYATNNDISIDLLNQLDTDNNIWEFTIHDFYIPFNALKIRKQLEKKKRSYESSYNLQMQRAWEVKPETLMMINEIWWLINQLAWQKIKMYNYISILKIISDNTEELYDKIAYIKTLLQTMSLIPVWYKHLQYKVHEAFWVLWNQKKFESLVKQKKLNWIISTHNELSGKRYIFNNYAQVIDKAYLESPFFKYKYDNNVNWILLWEDYWTWKIINRDLWDWESKNTMILGKTWTWKSYTAKLVDLREYMEWVKQIIIDPDNEFEKLTRQIGGNYVNIGNESQESEKINPFDFSFPRNLVSKFWKWINIEINANLEHYQTTLSNKYNSFVSSLKQFINIILSWEKLNKDFYKELSEIINKFFFEKWGINKKDITTYFKLANSPVSIVSFYSFIKEEIQSENDSERKKLLNDIKKWLFDYWDENWNYYHIFWQKRSWLNFKSNWTAFNLKHLWKDAWLKSVIVYSIMEYIQEIFSEKHLQRVRITLDEATTFIWDNMEMASYVFELYKRARKYNIWVTLILQWIDQLFTTFKSESKEVNYWKSFLQNTLNQIILWQQPIWLKAINENLSLNEPQHDFLNMISLSKEDTRWIALIITWKSVDQVKILSEEYIHKYITTDPDEMK